MGSQEALCIDRCYVDLIDSPDCDDHAWGKEVFYFTLYYMKKSIHTREQMHIYEKPEGAGYLYRCYGLILALQTWFYEVCDTAEGVICTTVGEHDIPRILKWEVRDSYNRLFLQRTFLNLPHTKFKNIVPTEEEKHTFSLDSFFKQKNELTRNEIASSPTTQLSNDVDVIKRLDSISAELESLKQAFFEFSRRVIAEFELFREKFITSVKSPVRGFRTKSEALMKSKADKSGHVQKNVDEERLNTGPVGKNVMEEAVISEPVEKIKAGKAVNRGLVQEEQEYVAGNGLNEVQFDAREKNAMVVYDPKHSRPLAGDFDITTSGKVHTGVYNDWIVEGLLQIAPRKVANGYNYCKVKSRKLPTPFDFNVASVTDKNWFYHINETGCFLDSSAYVELIPIFLDLVRFPKKAVHGPLEVVMVDNVPRQLNRCYGLILALQTWFYEVCDTAEGVICTSVGEHDIPRILKWEVRDSYNRLFLQRTFLNLPNTKFKNIVPTEEEKHTFSLDSFFKQKNELTRNVIASSPTTQLSNDVDVIKRLDSISAELESLKQAFFDFSRRVMAEFELFREKFITSVKSPVRGFRTKSEALMKSKADKRGFTYEPHPIFGYALNGSQPSFDAITVGLPPTPPQKKVIPDQQNNEEQEDVAGNRLNEVQADAREKNAMVVYDPKVDVVKKTTKSRKKLKTDVSIKTVIRLQHSRPLAGDFDITTSGKVHTGVYNDWIAEGLLQIAPRKVANGYNYCKVKSRKLPTPFDFNVASVTDKNWFYHINETGCFLDSSVYVDLIPIFLDLVRFPKKAVHGPLEVVMVDNVPQQLNR
ncbi:Unknown protein [Striga hermonthica]|uniref:Uncharacterized protein n=1 Tax=Striga hermonthica TaxID=68872 RepID=A0A9N7RIZ5_STRHE|nr:Unknown protein [Striga hermonthica]